MCCVLLDDGSSAKHTPEAHEPVISNVANIDFNTTEERTAIKPTLKGYEIETTYQQNLELNM